MMGRWRHRLEYQGKVLRATINNGGEDLESCKSTLNALRSCYDRIKELVKNDWLYFEDDYDNLEYYIDVLNLSDETWRENALRNAGFDGCNQALECVNENLRTFYDLCDYHGIWIGI